MNVLSLFDGISCGRLALERAGLSIDNYYASEIDQNAIKCATMNNPDIIELGSVTDWKNWEIDWSSINLLIGGSPCQGFSIAGEQLNFNDERSKLFFVFVDILHHIQAVNPKVLFLLENVKMRNDYSDIITKFLGVYPVMIDSALVSAQRRTRLYWANWQILPPKDKKILFRDIINFNLHSYRPIQNWMMKYWGKTIKLDRLKTIKADKASCLTTRKTHPFQYYLSEDKKTFTLLSQAEAEILQTLPEGYTSMLKEGQAFYALGNGWTVDVIAHIFSCMGNRTPQQLELF